MRKIKINTFQFDQLLNFLNTILSKMIIYLLKNIFRDSEWEIIKVTLIKTSQFNPFQIVLVERFLKFPVKKEKVAVLFRQQITN